ncbi:hypothetical protein FQN57_004325 [Myotisia sp. PD_48]|nr:hypothetical protein FQN57_004325 [Myotisia sp. PD_48]
MDIYRISFLWPLLTLLNLPIAAALPQPVSTNVAIAPGGIDNIEEEGGSGKNSGGSVNLSKNGQIAIIVIVTVVVVLGVASAILFYLAKKRQWEMRKKIRRSARRVAESIKSPGLMSPRSFRFASRPGSPTDAARTRETRQSSRQPSHPLSRFQSTSEGDGKSREERNPSTSTGSNEKADSPKVSTSMRENAGQDQKWNFSRLIPARKS